MAEPRGRTQALLLDAAAEALTALGWEREGSTAEGALLGTYTTENGSFTFVVEVYPDEPLVVCYSLYPETIPAERLGPIVELVARANDGLPRACLEFDVDSRLLRCRSYLDVGEVDVAGLSAGGFLVPLLRRVVVANFATLDLYLGAIGRVAAGELSAADADAAVLAEG